MIDSNSKLSGRFLILNLYPYNKESATLDIFSRCLFPDKNNVILAESAMLEGASKKSIFESTFGNLFIKWTNIRTLVSSEINSDTVKTILPHADEPTISEIVKLQYILPKIKIDSELMNLLHANCIRWGYYAKKNIKYLEKLIHFWYVYLTHSHIKILYAVTHPHSLEDLACFVVASSMGLHCYSYSLLPNNSLILMSWNDKRPVRHYHSDHMYSSIVLQSNLYWESVEQKGAGLSVLHNSTLQKEVKQNMHSGKARIISEITDYPNTIAYFYHLLLQDYIKSTLMSFDHFRKDQRFAYLPFQAQPEASTVPQALQWHDQFKTAIECRRILDDNIILLIKEHPYQFMVINELPVNSRLESLTYIRPLGEYSKISMLPNTYILPIQMKTKEVFKLFNPIVISISGTTGLEAFINGLDIMQLSETIYPYASLFTEINFEETSLLEKKSRFADFMGTYSLHRLDFDPLNKNHHIPGGDFFSDEDYMTAKLEQKYEWSFQLGKSASQCINHSISNLSMTEYK